MTDNDRIVEVIYGAVDEINQHLQGKQKVSKSLDTVLFGESAQLDSIGLVNLIVGVEEKIEEDFGVTVVIADERAISRKNTPFRTIRTLSNYVSLLLEDNEDE